ncbi:hypothetical protein BDN70DRAFT_925911 [Pholiota conissans]|uniref:GRF-type domain-containing protein n=1 Tax=Pholiota conissans TaxID=109636 RepID=A0A9P5YLE8_9AGAR|nr:hypothetical protein BDN70DRAFT_925911 [Pholiota conissans]
MATIRLTGQLNSGLGAKGVDGYPSNSTTQHILVEHGRTGRPNSIDEFEDLCFFLALCGLWTNTCLHIALVALYVAQSSPRFDLICWSLATFFWGIVALSVHSMRQANRVSKLDPSNVRARSSQTQIGEALVLAVFIAWYRAIVAQRTSPFMDFFSMCSSLATEEVGPAYYWGTLWGITLSECDLATAISSVTWVGPIALLLATWTMILRWTISPASVAHASLNDVLSTSATTSKSEKEADDRISMLSDTGSMLWDRHRFLSGLPAARPQWGAHPPIYRAMFSNKRQAASTVAPPVPLKKAKVADQADLNAFFARPSKPPSSSSAIVRKDSSAGGADNGKWQSITGRMAPMNPTRPRPCCRHGQATGIFTAFKSEANRGRTFYGCTK